MDSSGKNVRNNALRMTQKKRGPRLPHHVRNLNTVALTRKNNVGIQAEQPLVHEIVLPDIEEQNTVALPLLEDENAVNSVINPEQGQSLDHKIVLSDAVEEQSVPITSVPIRKGKGPSIAPKKVASSVAAPSVINGVNKSKQEAAPRPEQEMDDNDSPDYLNDTKPAQAAVSSHTAIVLNDQKKETCPQLYDPCTKEPISNLEELERRIRELKKQRNTTPVGLYGLTNQTSIYDFITNVFLNPDISLDDMVSFKLGEGRQVGSDIFEVLSRIFVLLGGIENVDTRTGGNYKFMKKIESRAPEVYDNTMDALRTMKCIASKESGMSDITLVYTGSETKKVDPNRPYCDGGCAVIDPEITKTYVMSVKWYKKEKNAEHYDLEKLFAAAHRLIDSPTRHPVDIIVFLKSKRDFEYAHSRAARQYTNKLAKTYFGWNENMKPFFEKKRYEIFTSAMTSGKSIEEAFILQYDKHVSKPVLTLQLHQDIIVKGICDRIDQKDDNLYLIGVLPRGGKTFIAGGIICEYIKRTSTRNINIFWLTAAPTETRSQVGKELIEQYQDFDSFDFIDVTSTPELRKTRPDSIFFCSSQLLTGGKKGDKQVEQKRKYLDGLIKSPDQLGLFFFDEAHKTGAGDETKDTIQAMIDMYQGNNLPFIFLTATYYNILIDYKIQKNNTFIWDYTDVLATRALGTEIEKSDALTNLRKRFGEDLVNDVLEKRKQSGDTYEMMAKAYIGFPDLYFISADFQKEALERFELQKAYSPDAGFSLDVIFSIKLPKRAIMAEDMRPKIIDGITISDVLTRKGSVRKDAYDIFVNLTHPKNMISLITPYGQFNENMTHKEGGEPFVKEKGSMIDPSILGRIDKISSKANNRFRLDKQPTILMFMPIGGVGTNIFYLLCAWASLLLTQSWWKDNYEIACVVDGETMPKINDNEQNEDNVINGIHIINKNPKAEIIELERTLHCRDKPKGLVILAGEKLSMGVSLPCTDVVFLFNTKKSPDDIIQKMYRALTPSSGKKISFVVDLNPLRTLAAVYGYTRASHQTLNTSTELLDVVYDTYSWDTDMFDMNLNKGVDARPLTFQDKLREMYEKVSKDADYRIHEDIGGIEKRMKKNIIKGLTEQSKDRLTDYFSSKKMESAIGALRLKFGAKATLSKGKLYVRRSKPSLSNSELNNDNDSESNDSESNDSESNAEIVIDNFIETVIDFVKYLAITSTKNTLYEAIKEYESNQVNGVNTNGMNVTLKSNVLSMVRSRVEITGSDNELLSTILVEAVKDYAQNSSEEIFREMKGKIDEKSIRKDKILALINKRLTPRQKQRKEHGEVFTPIPLAEEMVDHLPESIWSNPDLKWLDPAGGIGNLLVVVFYRLDEGLKKWEDDEPTRRKHIIENMLFMMEFQAGNNRIAKTIFDSLCKGCKSNILTIDSTSILNSDGADKLRSKHFPIEFDVIIGNPPYNKSLWEKFILLADKLVKQNGYIDYIVPTSWTSPTSDSWKTLKTKKIIVINSADYVKNEYFPNVSSTFSYFLIQNKSSDAATKIYYDKNKYVSKNLKQVDFMPKVLTADTLSINDKVLINKLDGSFIRKDRGPFRDTMNGTYKYPYITFLKQGNPDIKYLDKQDPRQHEKKVLLFRNGYINPYYDNGINGVGDNIHALTVSSKDEGEKIVKLFNSELYKYIWTINKHSAYNAGTLMDMVFRDVSKMDGLTDTDIYRFFHITIAEKETIHKQLGVKESNEEKNKEAIKKGGKRFNKTRKQRKN